MAHRSKPKTPRTKPETRGGARPDAGRKAGGKNAVQRDLVPKQVKLPRALLVRLRARSTQESTTDTAVIQRALERYLESTHPDPAP